MRRDPRRNPAVGDVLYINGKTLTVAGIDNLPGVGPDIGFHIEYDDGRTSIGGRELAAWRKEMRSAKVILRAAKEAR